MAAGRSSIPTVRCLSVVALLGFCGTQLPHAAFAQPTLTPTATPTPLDHFKLYGAHGPKGPAVTLVDQFDTENPTLGPARLFGNPVEKNKGTVFRPKEHLTCYEIPKAKPSLKLVDIDNQFGPQSLLVIQPSLLCVPSEKAVRPSPLPTPPAVFTIDHFKCYLSRAVGPTPTVRPTVSLKDQFGTSTGVEIERPFFFCNPVKKNDTDIKNPLDHLTCYRITDKVRPKDVTVRNQFFPDGSDVDLIETFGLCVPSRKLAVSPIPTPSPAPTPPVVRHFMCHEVEREPFVTRRGITLDDQFGPSVVDVRGPKRICNPANKNDEDPAAPSDPNHLMSYDIRQQSPAVATLRNVLVGDQFATYILDVSQPRRLLVPTAKDLTAQPGPPANPIDHFKCYRVHGARFQQSGLQVEDEFTRALGTPLSVDVRRPDQLCVPASKEGSGIQDPTQHLLCYKVRTNPGRIDPGSFFVNNQFDTGTFRITGPRELCVPAVKIF